MIAKRASRAIGPTFILTTVLTILFSLTGYLGELHYILDLTSSFKLQYLVIGFCTFFFFLITRQKAWCILSLFCILINLIEVLPWYLPQTAIATPTAAQQFRLWQSNVLYRNKQYSQVISLVKREDPDLAVFIEVSESWEKELTVLQEILPYSVVHRDDSRFGTAIYSKIPLQKSSIQYLGEGKKTIFAQIKLKDKILSVLTIHTSIPTKKSSFNFRNKELAELGDYIAKIKTPVLALGDFNITMWSPYYKHFVHQTGLRNARYGFGVLPSWPTYYMPLLSIPIDHCLVSPEIKVLKVRTGGNVGSDHLPLITDLVIY
ncbi:endonuclease/exonuclease/phosphatase family protein [Argonema galeatum]|uniref:endonuclease/exonuclease/phosphatase family protein n=1 Tax=Argonema galeatum TaxID=2942762 RepID=UPI002013884F|nr:endonuclease/exonuclease/phosphatase family protein [Argonema galeatum]MCL1465841.1 endonuclease/exonuclease/phosphatase family protein [Argonema galeatum A003/A1]